MKRWATAAVMLSAVLAACGSSAKQADTTTPGPSKSPFVIVPIKNDTSATVHFIQCKATCAELHERRTIAAGQMDSILGSNENLRFAYLVEDAAGKRIGCVYMQFNHVKAPPVVLVSSMKPCEE